MKALDSHEQPLNVGDWVVCSSTSSSGIYIGKIGTISAKKCQVIDLNGQRHSKDHDRVFLINHQIDKNPLILI